MASIKYSMNVADIRGKLSGGVFTRNRSGSVIRTKVTPSNPSSNYQVGVRQRFSVGAQLWKSLLITAIAGFNLLAKSYPVSNLFGDRVFLSGFNFFVKLNANLALIGVAPLTEVPVMTPATPMTSCSLDVSAPDVFDVTIVPAVIPTGTKLVIFATPPIPKTKEVSKNDFRLLAAGVSVSAGVYIGGPTYLAHFGTIPDGYKCYVKVFTINQVCGLASLPVSAYAVVA